MCLIKRIAVSREFKFRRIKKLPEESRCLRCKINHGNFNSCITKYGIDIINSKGTTARYVCSFIVSRHKPLKNYSYTIQYQY